MSMPDMRDETLGKAAIVLRAARRAFLAGGFGAVSMDAIAREAGVSKATVYAHFGSKEELFGAVVADVAEQRFGTFSAFELDPRDIEASLNTIARASTRIPLAFNQPRARDASRYATPPPI